MTEDEAKTKACCGPPAVAAATYWRGQAAVDAPMKCVGSACMSWRFTPYAPIERNTTDGYCGLAGAPI